MRIPSIRLYGKRKVQIITHKGVCSCGEKCIEIFSMAGIICVCGKDLEIMEITDEYLCINGKIESIAYK